MAKAKSASAAPTSGVPVTVRAVTQRLNRKLAEQNQQLKRSRGRSSSDLGDYYVLDFNNNSVVADHVNLTTLAKELGVLRPWEHVVEEE
jgi:hypothetical protein